MPEDQKQALISIHAPLRERRLPVSTIICRPKISIHAPLRERLEAAKERIEEADFNPRSLTGATLHCFVANVCRSFQSTLPYGSDASSGEAANTLSYFNPRSLTGATCATMLDNAGANISIHAPLRERPNDGVVTGIGWFISIHAPLRERPVLIAYKRTAFEISIHAPLRERPVKVTGLLFYISISIHAPLRERPYSRRYFYP